MFSPVDGLRVKATPVPESSPMLPKTIDCTLTAVPSRPRMFSTWRYLTARGCIQLLKTASIASSSCSSGSCGKGLPTCFW